MYAERTIIDTSEVESDLLTLYASMLEQFGTSVADARQMVSDAIAGCKMRGMAEGTASLPLDFGRRMIMAARQGETKSMKIVDRAVDDGATEADIEEWWGLHDLQRRMVKWSEDIYRLSTFRHAKSEGLDDDAAAGRVHQLFPIYGPRDSTAPFPGAAKPLPDELRGRVDRHRRALGADEILRWSAGFPTYNAFVRSEIDAGRL